MGRRSCLRSLVLKAELPKRSHQVVENKGFPILALVEIGCRNCKLPKSGASLLSLARIDSAPATARASSQGDEHLKMKSATRPHSAVPSLARRERVDGVTCALHPRARHAGRGESRARCARGGGDATRSERGRRGEEIGGDSATVGRGRPPALIRLARRSQIRRATVAPATFSRQREKGQSGTQKQTHSRVRRMDGVTM
jgi:hypothetical protein